MTSSPRVPRRLLIGLLSAALVVTALSVPPAESAGSQTVTQELPLEEGEIVRVLVPGSDEIHAMQDDGYDFAGDVDRVPNGVEVDLVITGDQLSGIDDYGAVLAEDAPAAPVAAPMPSTLQAGETDTVDIGRLDWFTTRGQGFISIEAKSSEHQAASLTATWEGGGSTPVFAYVDSGEYMYHRVQVPFDGDRPDTVTVTSSLGGETTGEVSDWLYPTDADIDRPGYEYGFIDGYMNPTELYERIEELADEYPEITEIVELPNETNGYRRLAQAILQPPEPPLPNLVTIDAPSTAEGRYEANGASFGPDPTETGISGDVVLVNDGSSDPTEGCDPLQDFPEGAVALIDRGSCAFTQKVGHAQDAGAVAVIVANNTGGTPINMGGSDSSITIPAVHVSQDDGATIREGLPASGTVMLNDAEMPPPQSPSLRVVVDSVEWGHEGGNDISVELADPGEEDAELAVSVNGNAVRVDLATDGDGEITSTAAEVVAALNDGAGSLVHAYTYRGNDGDGVVYPTPPTQLSDFLSAPDEISREPWNMRALRIGRDRDGSRTGVLIVAQDHAREWVVPLVALEAAERMLANYDNDPTIRRILRNVDIFIIPSNNPDGSHYSMFDRAFQRRNMTNHCERTGPADPLARGNWGVDLNRNYRIGSRHDGYTGASGSCTSDVYSGPEELSEPEAQNVVWLAETFENIKFFMTVHSSGGQLFWQPGSYIADGRITTPRPPLRDEQYYWELAEEILSNVKGLRDSVVQPRNVGGSSDVLYSSAGNVREDLYNNYGIYSFGWEVGGDQWDPEEYDFVSGGGFMPSWPEANQQYQEYASGVISMFELAMEYEHDDDPARTQLMQERRDDGSVDVTFKMSEPATIHYTTDGSAPTTDSPTYEAANIREPGEVINVTERTLFRWFSVDVKDHVEHERRELVRARGSD